MNLNKLRELCPTPIKNVYRRVRSRVLDPFGRGIGVNFSGVTVRVPGYFYGNARADYELSCFARFNRWLKEHPTGLVVDVGCNVSCYGVVALNASPSTEVIAVDPDFSSLVWTRLLCSLVEPPGRLLLVHGFVVDATSTPEDAGSAHRSIAAEVERRWRRAYKEATRYRDGSDPGERTVPRRTLDALLARVDRGRDLLVKIDVEGHEMEVLKGAVDTLRGARPVLLLSAHPQFGADLGELRAFLDSVGYSAEHFDTDHEQHWWCLPRAQAVS